jgi:hypothetical protein
MMLTEFRCDDCGAHVSAFQPIKPVWQSCATCTWISEKALLASWKALHRPQCASRWRSLSFVANSEPPDAA